MDLLKCKINNLQRLSISKPIYSSHNCGTNEGQKAEYARGRYDRWLITLTGR